jgi:membrane protease YdiL (CAAX protease family)
MHPISADPKDDLQPEKEAASLMARAILVGFCLLAGFTYRASVSVVPAGIAEDSFVLGLAALLLVLALMARRTETLRRFWEIPFAFFVFTVAGFFGDAMISPLQHLFVRDVLRETTTDNNPLASTVQGTVWAQVSATVLLAIPVVVLTRASGRSLRSIFIRRPANWWGLLVALVCFVAIYFLAVRGRTEAFFPTHGVLTQARIFALTPALIILVLLNGFREELWFRALFLNKYARFLSPLSSNVLAGVIFTSFHVQVQYSASILPFLGYALLIGLIAGWLMQRTNSVLAPAIFHAGTDIPIFLVYLSYVSN